MAWVLKAIGGCLAILVALAALANIGAYNPYPEPPADVIQRPFFGRSADIEFKSLFRKEREPLGTYQARLTKAVNAWMVHYWPAGDREFVGVHPIDNFPMWAKSFVAGYEHFANYEFVSPRMAWRRGYGFCSQLSRIVYSVLRAQGISATIMEHPNHVVVESEGAVLDADFGVFIPVSLKYIQSRPDIIGGYYGRKFPKLVNVLRAIYSDGWQETSSKRAFDRMLAFEAASRKWDWVLMLTTLWLVVAIFDAGLCWPRFWEWCAPLRRVVRKPCASGRK